MSSEEFYDVEIAPKLVELCNLCTLHGMSFLAAVEFSPNSLGVTQRMVNPGVEMHLAQLAVRARGNIDGLVTAAARHAREHGHSSIVLQQIGVPLTPAQNGGGQS